MPKTRTPFKWRPPRVRNEPPTLSEALNAARDISDQPAAQIEIAANLMGVALEEAKVRLAAEIGRTRDAVQISPAHTRRPVLVERRVIRAGISRRVAAREGA